MSKYLSRYTGTAIDSAVDKIQSMEKYVFPITDGTSYIINANKSNAGKNYGDTNYSGTYIKNTFITMTNDTETRWHCTLSDESGNTQEFLCPNYGSCTVKIEFDCTMLTVYSSLYPIIGTVSVAPLIDYLRDYSDHQLDFTSRLYGINKTIEAASADDGNTDHGYIRVDGYFCKGQVISFENLNDQISNNLTLQFNSAEGDVIMERSVPVGESSNIIIETDNVDHLSVYSNAFPIKCRIYSPSLDSTVAQFLLDNSDTRAVLESRLYGINRTIEASQADNGNTDHGRIRIDGYFCKGQIYTLENLNDQITNNITFEFNSAEDETVKTVVVHLGETKSVTIDDGSIRYINIYTNAFPIKCRIYSQSLDELITQQFSTDIVSLNKNIMPLLNNALKTVGITVPVPFCLLHFSDIHGDSKNLKRIVDMGNYLVDYIDDIICTGDLVNDEYGATNMNFWNSVEGAENILICIGNHDVHEHGNPDYSSDEIGQAATYDMYIEPYVNNWDVENTGSYTFYYKDYSDKQIRLITLNYLLTGTEMQYQLLWLNGLLEEANTLGYTVVIAEHAPPNNSTKIECSFTTHNKTWDYNQFPADYQDIVQNFIDGGGKFACYLCGHSHWDLISYNQSYPDQIFVTVTCAFVPGRTNMSNDMYRVNNDKSQDAANLTIIDVNTKTIKLIRIGADRDIYLRAREYVTISYENKEII